ncbi:MAG: hypothetical protein ABIR47_05240, partial [Candidatus Kapaibacterium sp.]
MERPIGINLLDQIQIATSCTASWEEMAGNDRTRHCSQCDLNVHNISAMTSREAKTLISSAEGRICVRLFRRADGTVITQDCPVGRRASRKRFVRSMPYIAAAVVALTGATTWYSTAGRHTNGGMALPFMQRERVTATVGDTVYVPSPPDTTRIDT